MLTMCYQMFLYAAHDILREDNDKAGYQLLKVFRVYINILMYSALEIQSSNTISAGRTAVRQIFAALEVFFFAVYILIFTFIYLTEI